MTTRPLNKFQVGVLLVDAVTLFVFSALYMATLPFVSYDVAVLGLGVVVFYAVGLAFYAVLSARGIRGEWTADSKREWLVMVGVYLGYVALVIGGLYAVFRVVDPLPVEQVLWLASILLFFPRVKFEADEGDITVKFSLFG